MIFRSMHHWTLNAPLLIFSSNTTAKFQFRIALEKLNFSSDKSAPKKEEKNTIPFSISYGKVWKKKLHVFCVDFFYLLGLLFSSKKR